MPKKTKSKAKGGAKKMSNEAPRSKFEGEHRYEFQEGEIGLKPPSKPAPKDDGWVKKFGQYLKGVTSGANRRSVEKVIQESLKQEGLKKKVAKRKKESRAARNRKWARGEREKLEK